MYNALRAATVKQAMFSMRTHVNTLCVAHVVRVVVVRCRLVGGLARGAAAIPHVLSVRAQRFISDIIVAALDATWRASCAREQLTGQ